ncbi:hypothetical protein C7270_26795 [Burkholderia thailandensis]|nr:hypothetical protein [Burkholderia thailandensis]
MTSVLHSRTDAPDARERARHDYSRRGGRNMTDGGTRNRARHADAAAERRFGGRRRTFAALPAARWLDVPAAASADVRDCTAAAPDGIAPAIQAAGSRRLADRLRPRPPRPPPELGRAAESPRPARHRFIACDVRGHGPCGEPARPGAHADDRRTWPGRRARKPVPAGRSARADRPARRARRPPTDTNCAPQRRT